VAELVRLFFSVTGLAGTLLAGAIWLRIRPASKAARRFLFAAAVIYLLASTYGVSYGVGRLLILGYDRFSADDAPGGRTAIVLLGSGSFTARDWSGGTYSIVDNAAAMRLIEAARVFRLANPAWIISSGGLVSKTAGARSAGSITMRDDLVRLGVPESRIALESGSANTHDEAVLVKPMLATLGVEHVILVTSELHMRRSVCTFRAEGIEAVPAMARGIFTTLPWYLWVLPSEAGLTEAGLLAHELIGIPYYLLRGWCRL
jgi:uncharacterized SAM-binding protein YcdF (DUF218 family)